MKRTLLLWAGLFSCVGIVLVCTSGCPSADGTVRKMIVKALSENGCRGCNTPDSEEEGETTEGEQIEGESGEGEIRINEGEPWVVREGESEPQLEGEAEGEGEIPLDPDGDEDGDGLNNGEETWQGTDPFSQDSDSDGISDVNEIRVYHTFPFAEDSDLDGVDDSEEIQTGKNPLYAEGAMAGYNTSLACTVMLRALCEERRQTGNATWDESFLIDAAERLRTISGVKDSGHYSTESCVWARLDDGTPYCVVVDQDLMELETKVSASRNEPKTHLENRESKTLPLPSREKRLFPDIGPLLSDPQNKLWENAISPQGYLTGKILFVRTKEGAVEKPLEAMTKSLLGYDCDVATPESGLTPNVSFFQNHLCDYSFVYVDAHGGIFPDAFGVSRPYLQTSEIATPENYERYQKNGFFETYLCLAHMEGLRGAMGFLQYGISDAFLRQEGRDFGKTSVIWMGVCDSATTPWQDRPTSVIATSLVTCLAQKGVPCVIGWDGRVKSRDASKAITYMFERMSGFDPIYPELKRIVGIKEEPHHIPWSFQWALLNLVDRGYDRSPNGAPPYKAELWISNDSLDFRMAPSIHSFRSAGKVLSFTGDLGTNLMLDTIKFPSRFVDILSVTCNAEECCVETRSREDNILDDYVLTVEGHSSNSIAIRRWTGHLDIVSSEEDTYHKIDVDVDYTIFGSMDRWLEHDLSSIEESCVGSSTTYLDESSLLSYTLSSQTDETLSIDQSEATILGQGENISATMCFESLPSDCMDQAFLSSEDIFSERFWGTVDIYPCAKNVHFSIAAILLFSFEADPALKIPYPLELGFDATLAEDGSIQRTVLEVDGYQITLIPNK